ncbi:LysR family transcriptional regulator [Ferrimonas marina]|uniref:DNA-binding transcriptional regulator, LysR family n=1 Tax=Ferrimonas marina TaxID=299255 RepID=A0A1M5Y2V9_9GAMM|nr:LysR family transcriptional regulator [Ferrimonas marina]SHI06342.1 DNA-binding transcriptional regulator, LysR family [Ferrimonas marina]
MRTSTMEIRHLRHFLMLCRKGSFSAAAEALHLSQPSLSRSIQRMEELLDAKLLDRQRSGVALTPYGESVLRHGERILRDVRQLSMELELMQSGDWSDIALGASPIPAQTLIGPIVGELTRQHPTLNLDLRVDGWRQNLALLEAGELNYFVDEVEATGLVKQDSLEVVPLAPIPAVICCNPQHPLLARPNLTMADLLQYPLALPRNLPNDFLEEHIPGLALGPMMAGRRVIRFDQFLTIKPALFDSHTLALTPLASVHEELTQGQLRILQVADLDEIPARYGVVSLKDRTQPPSAQSLVQAIVREADNIASAATRFI